MRRLILFASVFLIANLQASAQTPYPSVEVSGGYSYLNARVIDRDSLNGWGAGIAGNLNAYVGFVADFSGHYGNMTTPTSTFEFPGLPPITIPGFKLNTSKYLFLFGPRFSVRGDRVTGFAHVLAGGVKTNLKTSFRDVSFIGNPLELPGFNDSESGFAMAIGGGIDVKISKSFAIRVLQIDYVPERLGGQWQHNARAQVGLVFRID
jgi:hypothetical protein